MLYLKNKKSIQEVTSYLLLLGIVIGLSLTIFLYSENYIDKNISMMEEKYMKNKLSEIYDTLEFTNEFEGNKKNFNINIRKGMFLINNKSIKYISGVLKDIKNSEGTCLNNICEKIDDYTFMYYINLTENNINLNLSNEIRVSKGVFTFILENKNGSINIEVQ